MTDTTLEDRVGDRAAVAEAGTSVEKKGKTIFDLIRDQQGGFGRALPSMITPERFVRVAITTVRTTPKLAACDPMSLLGALTLSAQLGLEPGGPLGHAYLVPFGKEVTFILGYKGMIALARRSGDIGDIYAECVYEGDEFSWTLGLQRDIRHQPTAQDRVDSSKITHVYAVAKYRDGSEPSFVVLSRAQVEQFRSKSKQPNGQLWKDNYAAACMKTAVRRLSTWLPMSVELSRAVAADEQTITRIDVDADDFIDVDAVGEGEGHDADTTVADLDAALARQQLAENDGPTRDEIVELYKIAVKADPHGWTEFSAANAIPVDSRKWSDEQVAAVHAWITAEPVAT